MVLQEKTQELILHLLLWALVFGALAVSSIFWGEGGVHRVPWLIVEFLPFVGLHLLHHFLAVPFLLKRNRWLPYLGMVLGLLLVFLLLTLYFDPITPRPHFEVGHDIPGPDDMIRRPVPIPPQLMRLVMAMVVVGVDLSVSLYFKSRRDERRMQQLKTEQLTQQLATLRYQINPHFFMNTLNNIHALVDIDPEKAKESIEEFSKLMRIVLYDGNAPTILLQREIDFLQHYVSLMRLRYPDSVLISLSLPEEPADVDVPPLIMASFVENAFKHGISYNAPSFINISLAVEGGKVMFQCTNSRHPHLSAEQHGLGLENVRKRLELMYGSNYTLDVEETEERYSILMILPA